MTSSGARIYGVAVAAFCGCGGEPTSVEAIIHLRNPGALTFEGSGGALGTGLRISAAGVDDGQELVSNLSCQGRQCGEPANVDPGVCGEAAALIEAGNTLVLRWDGRYYPRGMDPVGPCLMPPRVLRVERVIMTVCGRLSGPGVKLASLACVEQEVTPPSGTERFDLTVPGAAQP